MPNVNDIAAIAEALEKQPVIVLEDRCVAVRNRNASCRACVQSCAFSALSVAANEITLDATSCVGCGACVIACPTEAFIAVASPESALSNAAQAALETAGNTAVVACARISSKRTADPEKYAEAPCLASVGETLILELAAAGAQRVVLVDGVCKTCKHRNCVLGLDETVTQAKILIEASGGSCEVVRQSAFPDDMLIDDSTGKFGSTRRGFFSDAVGAARDTAMVAAKTTLENELGMKAQQASIGERLRVTDSGSLPTIRTPLHERLLNAFDALGEPVGKHIDSRKFAVVTIDTDKCNSCGMCATFCPTGALKRNHAGKIPEPLRYIEFSAAECVNCRLCKDVCWKEALTLERGVDIEQLYDFEPRVFTMTQTAKRSPFGSF